MAAPLPGPAPAPAPARALAPARAPAPAPVRYQPLRPRIDERLSAWANFGAVAQKNEAEEARLAREQRDNGPELVLPAMNETWRQVGGSREKRTIIGVSKSQSGTKPPVPSPEISEDHSSPRLGVAGCELSTVIASSPSLLLTLLFSQMGSETLIRPHRHANCRFTRRREK